MPVSHRTHHSSPLRLTPHCTRRYHWLVIVAGAVLLQRVVCFAPHLGVSFRCHLYRRAVVLSHSCRLKVATMCNYDTVDTVATVDTVDTVDTVALADPARAAASPLPRRCCRAAAAALSASVCDRLRPERPLRLSTGSPSKWSSPHSGVDSFCVTDTCARAFTEPPQY